MLCSVIEDLETVVLEHSIQPNLSSFMHALNEYTAYSYAPCKSWLGLKRESTQFQQITHHNIITKTDK